MDYVYTFQCTYTRMLAEGTGVRNCYMAFRGCTADGGGSLVSGSTQDRATAAGDVGSDIKPLGREVELSILAAFSFYTRRRTSAFSQHVVGATSGCASASRTESCMTTPREFSLIHEQEHEW